MNFNESNIQPVPSADITQALDAINGGLAVLKNYLIALTPADRRSLPKMADGTEPFVAKGVEFANKGAVKLPDYVNKQLLDDNYGVYQSLVPVANALVDFYSLVSDTRMLAGSNALTEVLSYYDYAKGAAKRRVPGAKTVYEEMQRRYKKKKRSKAAKEDDTKPMEAVA